MFQQANKAGGRGPAVVSLDLGTPDDTKTVSHVLSCDSDHSMQDWIKTTGRPKVLVSDICECNEIAVLDVLSGTSVMRPHAKIAICGWSCVDAYRVIWYLISLLFLDLDLTCCHHFPSSQFEMSPPCSNFPDSMRPSDSISQIGVKKVLSKRVHMSSELSCLQIICFDHSDVRRVKILEVIQLFFNFAFYLLIWWYLYDMIRCRYDIDMMILWYRYDIDIWYMWKFDDIWYMLYDIWYSYDIVVIWYYIAVI